MKILMFGKTGQVAREMLRAVEVAEDVTIIALDRMEADLSDGLACRKAVKTYGPEVDVVVNAAAYTAVDRAETEVELAQGINGSSPGLIARSCAQIGVPFLHISTDYVFNGQGDQAWMPDDPTDPLGVYGSSKREGECQIEVAGGDFAIIRTSWVFSAHGANFVKTMRRLGATRDVLNVVGDQIGGPTPAAAIAEALIDMARAFVAGQGNSGIYHFSGTPDVSWAGFSREIFKQGNQAVTVTDIPGSDYPTPAARPENSRLDCRSLRASFGISRPDWRVHLKQVLAELSRQDD